METSSARTFFKSLDAGVSFGIPVFLYAKQELEGRQLFVVAHYPEGSRRTQVPIEHGVHSFCWVTDENGGVIGLLGREISERGELLSLRLIQRIGNTLEFMPPTMGSFPFSSLSSMVRVQKFGSYLVLVAVDAWRDAPTLAVGMLHSSTLGLITPLAYVEDTLNGGCSNRYWDDVEHQKNTNLTLVRGDFESCFVQVLNGHDTLSTFTIDVSTGTLDIQYDFTVDQSNIGAHTTAYVKQERTLVTCYAQYSGGNIYAVLNRIFAAPDTGGVPAASAGPVLLNDSPGVYFRPTLTPTPTGLLVSWEGNSVYIKEISYLAIPVTGEFTIAGNHPGNAHSLKHADSYHIGYQNECVEPRHVGLRYETTSLGVFKME